MPKGKVQMIDIDPKMFMQVLKAKGYSISKLADQAAEVDANGESPNIPTARALRRMLNNKNGARMQPKYLDEISKILNVDPRLLSGKIAKEMESFVRLMLETNESSSDDTQGDLIMNICRERCLCQIDKYPYYNERKSRLISEGGEDTISRVLLWLDVSYTQFLSLPRGQQYQIQKKIVESIYDILKPHFEQNVYGEPLEYSYGRIANDIDSYYEELDILEYADTVLREKYAKSRPRGYSTKEIREMQAKELLQLDIEKQFTDA